MIRRADESMTARLKKIWQACFDESREDTEFVFSGLLSPSRTLVRMGEDAQPVSMLNWITLSFTTPYGVLSGAYIFGVATLPEYRNRGFSAALMGELHSILRAQGISLACLVPASGFLFDFYRKQGFETEFYYKRIRIPAKNIQKFPGGALSVIRAQELKDTRDKFFAGRDLFGAWDIPYLRHTISECRFYGGEALRFSRYGRIGYAVCYPKKRGDILIKEFCAVRDDFPALLSALHARFGADGYEARIPVDFRLLPDYTKAEILPFAMVKWYDKKRRASEDRDGASWFAFALD